MIQLRDYQLEALDAVRGRYREGDRTALVVLATGGGKTLTALSAVAECIRRGGRVLWLAHREELLRQPLQAWQGLPQFSDAGRAGIVQGARDDADVDLVFASAQTVGRSPLDEGSRLDRILAHGPISLVVVDEAHHYPDDGRGQFGGLIAALRSRCDPYLLGLTATPERTDGRPLGSLWGSPAFVRGIHDLIEAGYLVRPTMQTEALVLDPATAAAIEAARTDAEAARVANDLIRDAITAHAVEVLARYHGRPSLVFAVSKVHVAELVEALAGDGWRAVGITDETRAADRRAYQTAYQRGELDVIVNCGVLTEGTDLPRTEVVALARPVRSKPLWIQIVGRGLRLSEGKDEAIVLDLFGLGHSLIHAAAMLDALDTRLPWVGLLLRDVGALVAGSRVRVAPTKRGGWEVVALVVSDCYELPEEPVEVEIGVDVHRETGSGAPTARILDTGRRSIPRPHWIHVSPRVRVCAAEGEVYLVETDDPGLWSAYHLPKRARSPRLMGGPLPIDIAEALGADLYRQAGGLSADARRAWASKRPSDGQLRYAETLGIEDGHAYTRGALADAITLHRARRLVARGVFS